MNIEERIKNAINEAALKEAITNTGCTEKQEEYISNMSRFTQSVGRVNRFDQVSSSPKEDDTSSNEAEIPAPSSGPGIR